ncbi:MAG: PD-(D/E)XK nuclease family protein [Cyanobacteria bacterium J06638_20]
MQISQGQLNTLAYCPRRFQHTYLEQLSAPPSPTQQAALTLGDRFHLLMQQRELGLAIAPTQGSSEEDSQIYEAVERFLASAPEILQRDRVQFRQSEHRRSLPLQGFLLTAVYDLLILKSDQAEILDWKTYATIPASDILKDNWQHKLYPFVLAETSRYIPEQITMSYWFVRPQTIQTEDSPAHITFSYDQETHEKTKQELQQILATLTTYLQTFETGYSLPQVSETSDRCSPCPFAIRCQRVRSNTYTQATIITLDEIDEIAI